MLIIMEQSESGRKGEKMRQKGEIHKYCANVEEGNVVTMIIKSLKLPSSIEGKKSLR